MKLLAPTIVVSLTLLAPARLAGQAPVTGVADPESLFTDRDPKLHANKQVVLHIVRDLLECNHWDEADKWLTPEYIQHNPLVASGRDPVVKFFGSRPKKPIPEKMRLAMRMGTPRERRDSVSFEVAHRGLPAPNRLS